MSTNVFHMQPAIFHLSKQGYLLKKVQNDNKMFSLDKGQNKYTQKLFFFLASYFSILLFHDKDCSGVAPVFKGFWQRTIFFCCLRIY